MVLSFKRVQNKQRKKNQRNQLNSVADLKKGRQNGAFVKSWPRDRPVEDVQSTLSDR